MRMIRHTVPFLLAALPMAAAAQDHVHATPQDALEALMSAVASDTPERVVSVVGPDAADLVRDAESEERREDWATVLSAYREGYRFVPSEDGRVTIELGRDDWPFPIDLVRGESGWSFDVSGGREEILARQIGLNELEVIAALQGYVVLQREFRQVDHDGDGVMEFAAHVISEDGTRDGLYWPGGDSPVGDRVARASLDGYDDGGEAVAEPYLGYLFRVLNEQGEAAPGGAMNSLVNGHQLAGHALLAVPAEYGESGINSFLVGENGIVWEADLGPESLDLGLDITAFDPGEGWTVVE